MPDRNKFVHYLELKTGSASKVGCVLRVYLSSKPSDERPGTFRSLKNKFH